MPRALRILGHALAALSVALCVGTCALWPRGYSQGDAAGYDFWWAGTVRSIELHSYHGRIGLVVWNYGPYTRPIVWGYWNPVASDDALAWGEMGEGLVACGLGRHPHVNAPAWVWALAFALPPAVWVWHSRRRGRVSAAGAYPVEVSEAQPTRDNAPTGKL
jgi:hypothetical protein